MNEKFVLGLVDIGKVFPEQCRYIGSVCERAMSAIKLDLFQKTKPAREKHQCSSGISSCARTNAM